MTAPELCRQTLGPIFHDFCRKLEHRSHGSDAPILFMTRAGIVLKRLYNTHAPQDEKRCKLFGASRLALTKALVPVDAQRAFAITRETHAHSGLEEILSALTDGEIKPSKNASSSPSLEEAYLEEAQLPQTSAYFKNQLESLREYIASLQVSDKAIVVDSGWRGTSQMILQAIFPNIDWRGYYVGRVDTPDPAYRAMSAEGLSYDSAKHRSHENEYSLWYYNHLFEDALEPNCPSVSGYQAGLPYPKSTLEDKHETHPFINEVETYIASNKALSHRAIENLAQEAFCRLHRLVFFPKRDELKTLTMRDRSSDFGLKERVSILDTDPNEPTWKRFKFSLWPTGQVAKDFPQPAAYLLQAFIYLTNLACPK